MLEEINYFDGDASAVAADLTNNVDVNTFFARVTEYGDFFKFSDILSRSEWVALELEKSREWRSKSEELHLTNFSSIHDQISGKHKEVVWVSKEM